MESGAGVVSWLAGESGRRLNDGDWDMRRLGPAGAWDPELRAAASLVLRSGFPMFLLWGPDRALIYNDAYAPVLGDRHPSALGQPFRAVWPEVADEITPMIEAAFAGGSHLFEDMRTELAREGRLEPAWFTFSYSPILGADGGVPGVLCVCVETTQAVRGRLMAEATAERLQFLDRLATEAGRRVSAADVLQATTRLLGQHMGASVCAYADMDEDQDGFTIRGDWSAPGSTSIVGHYSLALFGRMAVENLHAGRPLVINNNLEEIAPDEAATFQAIGITATICIPLVKEGRLRALMAVHHKGPHRWTKDELALVREVTDRSWAHVERAAAEAELRISEDRLRLATEYAEVGLWDVDPVADTLFWPARVKAMFGISADTPVTMADYYEGVHPDDREATFAAFAAAADPEQRALYDVEYRTVGKEDGRLRWVAAKGRGVFDANGRCTRVIGTALDVTERNAAAERLARNEAALRHLNETLEQRVATALAERRLLAGIVDNTDAFVQVVDRRFRWMAINKAAAGEFERIFGVRPKAGDNMLDVLAARPDLQDELQEQWTRALGEADGFTALQTLDGRTYEAKFNPLRGGDGARVGAFQFAYDVTERLSEQARLREAELALQQAQKMETVGQLTGGIAHDFNNLLQGVVGSFDLIRRKPDDPARVTRWAEAGLVAAERGAKLTGQLLAFARAQKIEARPLIVADLLDAMGDLLKRTLGPSYRVDLQLDHARAPVLADPVQLEMAVLNLAVNARDAMPDGGVLTIRTEPTEVAGDVELAAGAYVVLSVCDAGQGMSPEVAARAFDPFFTTKPVGQGTGLGLSQVYGIARQSGGAARIESRPGHGTTIRLYLPRTAEAPAVPADQDPMAGPVESRHATVLLVDDDPEVRRFMEDGLDALGYSVLSAADGPSALELLQAQAPDAMVLDFAMPGMNGAEVYWRAKARRPDLPIIMASGYADSRAIEAAAGDGVTQLRKPFRIAELQEALRQALEVRAGPTAQPEPLADSGVPQSE